jgi:hypothetical protein
LHERPPIPRQGYIRDDFGLQPAHSADEWKILSKNWLLFNGLLADWRATLDKTANTYIIEIPT